MFDKFTDAFAQGLGWGCGLLACLFLLATCTPTPAPAQERPTRDDPPHYNRPPVPHDKMPHLDHWFEWECCSNFDCHELEPEEVTQVPGGWMVGERTELIPFDAPYVKDTPPAGKGRMGICTDGGWYIDADGDGIYNERNWNGRIICFYRGEPLL